MKESLNTTPSKQETSFRKQEELIILGLLDVPSVNGSGEIPLFPQQYVFMEEKTKRRWKIADIRLTYYMSDLVHTNSSGRWMSVEEILALGVDPTAPDSKPQLNVEGALPVNIGAFQAQVEGEQHESRVRNVEYATNLQPDEASALHDKLWFAEGAKITDIASGDRWQITDLRREYYLAELEETRDEKGEATDVAVNAGSDGWRSTREVAAMVNGIDVSFSEDERARTDTTKAKDVIFTAFNFKAGDIVRAPGEDIKTPKSWTIMGFLPGEEKILLTNDRKESKVITFNQLLRWNATKSELDVAAQNIGNVLK